MGNSGSLDGPTCHESQGARPQGHPIDGKFVRSCPNRRGTPRSSAARPEASSQQRALTPCMTGVSGSAHGRITRAKEHTIVRVGSRRTIVTLPCACRVGASLPPPHWSDFAVQPFQRSVAHGGEDTANHGLSSLEKSLAALRCKAVRTSQQHSCCCLGSHAPSHIRPVVAQSRQADRAAPTAS